MREFWLCFVPLFVAVDPVGVLPMFLALTEGIPEKQIRRVVLASVATALSVALVFLAIGELALRLLGITFGDFMIAGGALLFVLSLSDMLSVEKRQRSVDLEGLGAVPLGVPLVVGPAVLTTSILLLREHGLVPTVAATVTNVLLAGAVFWMAVPLHRALGSAGTKIISKLASLLLAAIAVMMIRKGLMSFL